MGRPPITLTEHQRGEVETLASLLNQDRIADYLGIARNTFRAICARDPEVLERYKKGKARAIAHVANGLLQKARSGCTTSSIFYLKTQGGWQEKTAIQHSDRTTVRASRRRPDETRSRQLAGTPGGGGHIPATLRRKPAASLSARAAMIPTGG